MFRRNRMWVGAVVAAILTWLLAPHTYAEFTSIRQKVVRAPVAASGGQLLVPVPEEPSLGELRTPFAVISRVRNDGTSPLTVQVAADNREICAAEIAPGRSQRIDCAVRDSWSTSANHSLLFSSASPAFTVEYLELATHHGALSPGPGDLILVPVKSPAFERSSVWHLLEAFALLMISIASVRYRGLPRVVSALHLALAVLVAAVLVATIVSSLVSDYSLLISQGFLGQLLLLTALPMLVDRTRAALIWVRQQHPAALPVCAGLIVGALFWFGAVQQADRYYQGQLSGLLRVSHNFFDKSPFAGREDVEASLVFAPGNGYDGQYFYLMTFDPFVSTFRHEPQRYVDFIDFPPYRYGRIGFSLLTKVFSGDNPVRYPVTMVTIVLVALAVSGMLLGAIARSYGLSPWFGLLILLVPGFRECSLLTLPEPVAIAFVLAAYLSARHEKWLACGALLGISMLTRETGGGLVLALPVGMVLSGKWRQAIAVAALAFLPVVLWKGFLGWVFWDSFGMTGVMPHPNDAGLPFAGVVNLWQTIARGEYYGGRWETVRAGLTYPILTTTAAALAMAVMIKRPSPAAGAALFYGLLTITFNYEAVWLDMSNAHRLTTDLFVALALVTVQPWNGQRVWPRVMTTFWWVTAIYVLFWSYQANEIRAAAMGVLTDW